MLLLSIAPRENRARRLAEIGVSPRQNCLPNAVKTIGFSIDGPRQY